MNLVQYYHIHPGQGASTIVHRKERKETVWIASLEKENRVVSLRIQTKRMI
jgi:hypothetical protein